MKAEDRMEFWSCVGGWLGAEINNKNGNKIELRFGNKVNILGIGGIFKKPDEKSSPK